MSQPKNSDSALLTFIERIKNDKNKRFIITSRTTFVNEAKLRFKNFKDPIFDISSHQVTINDYDLFDKAKILYNHLYFSDLPHEFDSKFFEEKNYWKILKHPNFNPRIIEFISDFRRLSKVSPAGYLDYVISKLNSPEDVWEQSFEQDIDSYCRFFLSTMLSLYSSRVANGIREENLREAYFFRLEYEIRKNGYVRDNNPFYLQVRQLLDGFVKRTIKEDENDTAFYNFFNPSFVDFMISYINKNNDEKWRILNSIKYFEQFENIFGKRMSLNVNKIKISEEELPKLLDWIRKKELTFESLSNSSFKVSLLYQYLVFFNLNEILVDIKRIFLSIDFDFFSYKQAGELKEILNVIVDNQDLNEMVISRWDMIIHFLLRNLVFETDIDEVINLFDLYDLSYKEYITIQSNYDYVQERIDKYIKFHLDEYVDELLPRSEISNFHELQDELKNVVDDIQSSLNKTMVEIFIDDIDPQKYWNKYFEDTEYDDENIEDVRSEQVGTLSDSEIEIMVDNLFEKQ